MARRKGVSVRPVGILYEHPEWFKPLFAELDRQSVPFEPIDAAHHTFEPGSRSNPYSLVVNRMSPSAWLRGHGQAIFHTLDFLSHLESIGANVLNGRQAYELEISKARQLGLFASLGIRYPRARVVNDQSQIVEAAEGLRYPLLLKPNIGGSGGGIRSFAAPDELAEAVATGAAIEMGLDHTMLVQEHLPARGDSIVRIEILDGDFLYAIRIHLLPGSFNLCPADYCELPGVADGVSGRGLPIESYRPPDAVVEQARRIVGSAGMDVGGVEYLVNDRDGEAYFYDVNALSNFVADAVEVIGFDPFVNLAGVIGQRAGQPTVAVA